MVASKQLEKDEDLIRKIWGRYLQNEWKYDKYGAIGKILLIEEVLNENGSFQRLERGSPAAYQSFINEIFPRTFYCERPRTLRPALTGMVSNYFDGLTMELKAGGVNEDVLHSVALEETAEHFCLPLRVVEKIVRLPHEKMGGNE